MKQNIEKHFLLLIFIFVLSIVNISSTFALGLKKEFLSNANDLLVSAKDYITNGKVDVEACKKKDDTKSGIAQYSATCRTQCISTEEKFTQFKEDNKRVCGLFNLVDISAEAKGSASGTGGASNKEQRIENLIQNIDNLVQNIDNLVQNIDNLVQEVVAKLNSADTGALEAIIPDFTSQQVSKEFTITFSDKLRDSLQAIIFAQPVATRPVAVTASYNVLNEDTKTVPDHHHNIKTPDKASIEKIKERAVGIIKTIILKSFDPTPDASRYSEEVIKELRENWLNLDLKGDATTKDADFTVAKFKATTAGTVGYSLPHYLYHSSIDATLTNAIKDNAEDAAAKKAFVEAYKNYVSKNIKIGVQSDTWEEGQSLEFKVSLNAGDTPPVPDAGAPIVGAVAGGGDAAEIPSLTEDEINNADLSTKEAFDKIEKVFSIALSTIPYRDLGFSNYNSLLQYIGLTGLFPLRITIAPRSAVPDTTQPDLSALYDKNLEQFERIFTQRIIALAKNAPELGDATPGSLYGEIYKHTRLILKQVPDLKLQGRSTWENYHSTNLDNAKVIAVRKGSEDASAIDILLALVGKDEYPFTKYSGISVSHAHIVERLSWGRGFFIGRNRFFAAENFKDGLVPRTTATDNCSAPDSFVTANDACRNLLKIELLDSLKTSLKLDNGRDNGSDYSNVWRNFIKDIFEKLGQFRNFANYFNPDTQGDTNSFYASDAEKQLRNSKNIEGFEYSDNFKNWATTQEAYKNFHDLIILTNLNILTKNIPNIKEYLFNRDSKVVNANNINFLFRSDGNPKAVYLTKVLARRN